MRQLIVLLLTAATSYAPPTDAQALSRDECLSVKKKIDRYQEMRRRGGPVSSMESWKRELRKYEAQYNKARCRKYGKEFW